MRINDLFAESRRPGQGRIGASGGAKRYQTDQMVDVTLQKHLYDREKAAAKAAMPREPQKPVDADNIVIRSFSIPIDAVEHWIETRDVDWALNYAADKKWKMTRVPETVRKLIVQEPEWQETVLDVWKLAAHFLNLEKKTIAKRKELEDQPEWWKWRTKDNQPPEWWEEVPGRRQLYLTKKRRSGKPAFFGTSREKEAGINDPDLTATKLEQRLFNIINTITRNNGYDITGRQLPPGSW